MGAEHDGPTLKIEHDHTQLHVLLEDLMALTLEALIAGDEALLQDARLHCSLFQTEMARHFGNEERRLFSWIVTLFPDQRAAIEKLVQEHRSLRAKMHELSLMLEGDLEEVLLRRAACEQAWERIEAMWRQHSGDEWTLLLSASIRLRSVPEGRTSSSETTDELHPLLSHRA